MCVSMNNHRVIMQFHYDFIVLRAPKGLNFLGFYSIIFESIFLMRPLKMIIQTIHVCLL
jgi:hypothetical protein